MDRFVTRTLPPTTKGFAGTIDPPSFVHRSSFNNGFHAVAWPLPHGSTKDRNPNSALRRRMPRVRHQFPFRSLAFNVIVHYLGLSNIMG